MHQQIIVNLSVKDLGKSRAYFSALGYSFNPMVASDDVALMIVSENGINAMLMTEPFFESFHSKQIASARDACDLWTELTRESQKEIDGLIAKTLAAGAIASGEAHGHGFMYVHGFDDLDRHTWRLNYAGRMQGRSRA